MILRRDVGMPIGAFSPHVAGDWEGLRKSIDAGVEADLAEFEPGGGVDSESLTFASFDGSDIGGLWYRSEAAAVGPAVVYAHGGGMIGGTAKNHDPLLRQYARITNVPFLSVDYRLSPEHRGDIATRDVFAAVEWLIQNADSRGVDPARIAVMGDSAGGGLAAGAAILARDAGVALAAQILIYPMLDDRVREADPHIATAATWTYEMNHTAWDARLGGGDRDTRSVSPVVAPARLQQHVGLAPAYIEVGTLDIFRDEDIAHAAGLLRAGVDTELHVLPGATHGYDLVDGGRSDLARQCWELRARYIGGI